MSDDHIHTEMPAYTRYGDFALTNAIAHLLNDVRDGKHPPHSARKLAEAMYVLNQRVAAVLPAGAKA